MEADKPLAPELGERTDEGPAGPSLEAVVEALDGIEALGDACVDSAGGGPGLSELLEAQRQAIEGLGELASEAGLAGLEDVSLLYGEAVGGLAERDQGLSQEEARHLRIWPGLVRRFLEAPLETQTAEALLAHLGHPCLGLGLSSQDTAALASLFTIPMAADDRSRDSMLTDDELSAMLTEAASDAVANPPGGGSASANAPAPESDRSATPAASSDVPAAPEKSALVTKEARELIDLLVFELSELKESLDGALGREAQGDDAALSEHAELLQRFGAAAESVGFEGVHRLCVHSVENIELLTSQGAGLVEKHRALLGRWQALLGRHLENVTCLEAAEAFAAQARDPEWPRPLTEDAVREVLSELGAPNTIPADEEAPQRPSRATPEDMSLDLSFDVSAELLDGLLQELPTQTADLSAAVQRLFEGRGARADIELAQRIAHTLKGAANTVGVTGIANLTHHLEDILLAFKKAELVPGRTIAEMLIRVGDCLEMMSEALLGIGAPPEDAVDVLQEVLDWAGRIDQEGAAAHAGGAATKPEETTLQGSAPRVADAQPEQDAPAVDPQPQTMVRVPAPLLDDLLRLVSETVIVTGQLKEQVETARDQVRAMHCQFGRIQQLGLDLEERIDVRGTAVPRIASRSRNGFDALELEHYSELDTIGRQLVEAAADARAMGSLLDERLSVLDVMLVAQGRLNDESQEKVLRTRMVPVQNIISRLHRSIRQTCRLTGKEVDLQVNGSGTLMDQDALSDLMDPLAHVLRNAVDHGIEGEAERRVRGKEITGRIELDFRQDGNHIVVACKDDGGGLDFEAIERTARSKGLIAPDAKPTDQELSRFILRPDFSTRSTTTQTSGRGIGLNAVHARVSELDGSVEVASDPGRGCTVELRLPLSLISTHALLVRAGARLVAISSRGIEQILHPDVGHLQRIGDEDVFQLREDIFPASRLEALLGVEHELAANAPAPRTVMLVQVAGERRALLIQEVIASRELVVKDMGEFVPGVPGVTGAAILGDGSVVSVIDVPDLLRGSVAVEQTPDMEMSLTGEVMAALPRALVVDDSLTARRYLAKFMEDSGYAVRTARDGMEAVDVLNEECPDVLLVDMEMPRMNGLELTSHVRAQEAMRDTPVIMVTSRSTQKHRGEAEAAGVSLYLTKPFAEEELSSHLEAMRSRRGAA